MNNLSKVIIYHHDDADGYAAAYIVGKYVKNELNTEPQYIEMNYNKKIDLSIIDKDTKVYIVDYSIEPDVMINLLKITTDVIWLDHHKSAIEKYNDWNSLIEEATGVKKIKGIRLSGMCGATLSFLYINLKLEDTDKIDKNKELTDNEKDTLAKYFLSVAPIWLRLVDCWDTWYEVSPIFKDAEKLQIAIANCLSIDLFKKLDEEEDFLDELLETGKTYIEYRTQWAKEFMDKYGFDSNIHYKDTVISLFVANLGNANSKYFGDKIDAYDAVCSYCFDGTRWNYSIYSNKENIDVSEIAKEFGGGGHKGAAGFSTNELIFRKSIIYSREE
jgi:oligoribonuclease NrnB/cAMP/cGMP phosphodiesterase (DHH superfamily)